jgi:hypothetical protein
MAKQGGGAYPSPCSFLAQRLCGVCTPSPHSALSQKVARRTTFNAPLSAQQSETELNLRRSELNGSSEFTTWVALAGAAILAGLTAIYSSSPFVLIAAALIGAYLGWKGEQLGRAYVERRLGRNRSR